MKRLRHAAFCVLTLGALVTLRAQPVAASAGAVQVESGGYYCDYNGCSGAETQCVIACRSYGCVFWQELSYCYYNDRFGEYCYACWCYECQP